jgi:hypothetical protein
VKAIYLKKLRNINFNLCYEVCDVCEVFMNIGSNSGSPSNIATAGIQQSTEQVKQAAKQVVEATTARPTQGTVEVTDALIKLKEGEQGVALNVKVLDATDKQIGSLLDIEA